MDRIIEIKAAVFDIMHQQGVLQQQVQGLEQQKIPLLQELEKLQREGAASGND